ncbi:MAG: hypothetical protein IH614_00690 [Desulfuromonadales bacterium]|nr:hypothetical protein [Desulfuromonadales bacterium]
MRWLPITLGALFGAKALRLPGMVLGAGLGWSLALLLETQERLTRLEEASGGQLAEPPLFPYEGEIPEDRYPETAVIDALREGDPSAEMATFFDEVSGRGKR